MTHDPNQRHWFDDPISTKNGCIRDHCDRESLATKNDIARITHTLNVILFFVSLAAGSALSIAVNIWFK